MSALLAPEEICELPGTIPTGSDFLFPDNHNYQQGEHQGCTKKYQGSIKDEKAGGASIDGVHIEGPFINAEKKGTHDPNWIVTPRKADYDEYREIMGDLKIHITVAPEIEVGMEFIDYVVKNGGTVGIGHSNSDYNMALEGIRAGASIFTHLFNAMVGIHHRGPGAVGAALTGDAYVR